MTEPPDRFERRKAKTRRSIVDAANRLFEAKGYANTSMDDISVAADVAIRTIYLHFSSKAAVLLAHFDDWLDEFVQLFGERPATEELDAMMDAVLTTMAERGWTDNRNLGQMTVLHPVVEFLGQGDGEIAGHVMHRWVWAQGELTEQFRRRSGLPEDALEPRVQAAAVYASWMTSVLTFRSHFLAGLPLELSSHDVGRAALVSFMRGLGTSSPGSG